MSIQLRFLKGKWEFGKYKLQYRDFDNFRVPAWSKWQDVPMVDEPDFNKEIDAAFKKHDAILKDKRMDDEPQDAQERVNELRDEWEKEPRYGEYCRECFYQRDGCDKHRQLKKEPVRECEHVYSRQDPGIYISSSNCLKCGSSKPLTKETPMEPTGVEKRALWRQMLYAWTESDKPVTPEQEWYAKKMADAALKAVLKVIESIDFRIAYEHKTWIPVWELKQRLKALAEG